MWMFCSKMVKPLPQLRRRPRDVIFVPGYILFGYYHSVIKWKAWRTRDSTEWVGRKIRSQVVDIETAEEMKEGGM